MSLEEMEKRMQALEAVEAIKRLKSRYAQILDGFLKEDIGTIFTKDAVWDIEKRWMLRGREAIREFFNNEFRKTLPFTLHYFLAPDITVEGESARGRWYLWVPCTSGDGRAVWSAGFQDDLYEKVDGTWLISKIKLTSSFRTPYEEGWHKKRSLL